MPSSADSRKVKSLTSRPVTPAPGARKTTAVWSDAARGREGSPFEATPAAPPSRRSPGHPRPSDKQIARLERELERGPLAHGWVDQRWTLARVKNLIGRLFHVSYTVEGTWRRLLKLHGWSWQQPHSPRDRA
ncbi:winged helix-turn-helix domain-containing protein [Streptomyces mirabilis]|uniref:helix-turn-helix domain-containing protein n=1 Tax=Streptomyces mirabilis TaxID=68239 RepID=UPI0036979473